MKSKGRKMVACLMVALCVAVARADTPAHLYTVDLGPGNEDLERQINALPWINAPGAVYPMKDASKIDFSGRDLRCAAIHFELKGLYGARFDGCRLDGSTFSETRLFACSFRNASLRFCEMDYCYHGPKSSNDFTNADIEGSYLVDFPAEFLKQTRNYCDGRLSGIRMPQGNVAGLSFKGMTLEGGTLGPWYTKLAGCDFTDATLRRMAITPQFSERQLRTTKNGQRRDYSDLLFSCSSNPTKGVTSDDFADWDFSHCNLAYFATCNLTNAQFDNAFFLYPVHHNGGVLSLYSEFHPGMYYEIVMSGFIGFDSCNLSESQLRQTANWKRKDLRGMHLKNMNLDGWNFSGMDMEGGDLSGSSLKGTNFTGANITRLKLDGSTGLTLRQLQETKTFPNGSAIDILHAYLHVDFLGLTDEQPVLQQSLRQKWPKP